MDQIVISEDKRLIGFYKHEGINELHVEGAALEIYDKYIFIAKDFGGFIPMITGDTLDVTCEV